tara:strand:- start:1113 stop:1937 length:825 start_codon:yes stop_codon:yes gene_type:complete
MKMRHNKKRNTGFLYEALIVELTKTVVNGDADKKKQITAILKEFFKPGSVLAKELEYYRSLNETDSMQPYTAEKLLCESRNQYSMLDKKEIFKTQTKLVNKINKMVSKETFNNFVPNYKSLATIYQIFNDSMSIKKRVILEEEILKRMIRVPSEQKEVEIKNIDNIVFNSFSKKFNNKYLSLHEEQKKLLKTYVSAAADNSISLKVFLNEEIKRLKSKLEESLKSTEEIIADASMVSRTEEVIDFLDSCSSKLIDQSMVEKVLKIQELAREIEQ